MGRQVPEDEFRGLFSSARPVRIGEIGGLLGIARPTVSNLMKRHGTLTSVNSGGEHCQLSRLCRFDELGFARVGKMLFFRDGNQLAAIVRLVESSEKGLTLPEINEFFGVKVPMQLLKLSREGRLMRLEMSEGLVYFASDEVVAARQGQARRGKAPTEAETPSLAERLSAESREELESLSLVLLSLVKKPASSIKGIALSLQRQGKKITTEQVRAMFSRFDIAKKNS